MLVNCECDIYLCRECSGPGIDWADHGAFGLGARRPVKPISDAYDLYDKLFVYFCLH